MRINRHIKKLITIICTNISLKKVVHGRDCLCNYMCKFTPNTKIGSDCHFNGIKIYGEGNVTIQDHFHSGKNIKILTTFHDYDHGTKLPYDTSTYSRDVVIGENVWFGDDILVLGGITVGEGAVIQAGSVICKDVPACSIAGGHPATPFKYRDLEHYYKLKNGHVPN